MSFFSSCIKIIFITALAFSLYSGNSLALARHMRKPPNCDAYKGQLFICPNQVDPVCAKHGRTYNNECFFCDGVLNSHRIIKFGHYGKCR